MSLAFDDLPALFRRLDNGESIELGEGPVSGGSVPDDRSSWLGLRTSGSTGAARCLWHRWSDLKRDATVAQEIAGWTWATPFRPDSFAGIQVAMQAWIAGGRCLGLNGDWSGIWQALGENHPEALCATPTFLQLLLGSEPTVTTPPGGSWSPRQITLGGEPLRSGLGRRAQSRFPTTRFTVVYAATETGIILKTHRVDGWYESAALARRWDAWRVRDGVLELNRRDRWQSTSDLVEVRNDVFRVLGRAGSVANVGGTKVNLAVVEALAEEVEGVQQARASAEANPVTGQVVVLEYSVVPGAGADDVAVRLETELRRSLPKEAWPRRWVACEPRLGANAKKPV